MPDNEQTIQDAQMSSYLGNIASAVYGRQVRDSIVNAITKCYLDTSTSKTLAQDKIDELDEALHGENGLGELMTEIGGIQEDLEEILSTADEKIANVDSAVQTAIDNSTSTVSEVNAYLNIYSEGE